MRYRVTAALVAMVLGMLAAPFVSFGQPPPGEPAVTLTLQGDSAVVTGTWSEAQGNFQKTYRWATAGQVGNTAGLEASVTLARDSTDTSRAFCVRTIRTRDGKESQDRCTSYVVPGLPEPEEPVVSPDTVEVTVDTTAVEDTTIAEPEPTPTGDHPHEPSGFTKITERSWSAFDEDGWTHGTENNYSIVSDGTAPRSPSSIGQMFYRGESSAGACDGHQEGRGPGITSRDFSPKTELYAHFWIKVSDPFQAHGTGVNKIIFLFGSDGDEKAFWNAGASSGLKCTSGCAGAYLGLNIKAHGTWGGNLQHAPFKVGQWHEVETILRHNTPGMADGEIHIWFNGTKTHEHFDAIFSRSGEVGDFANIRWNPTWGGTDGSCVEQDMWMWLDHLYVSGR